MGKAGEQALQGPTKKLDCLKPKTFDGAHQHDIEVFFISGYADNATVYQGILNPGMDFLQKPFDPSAFAQKVREILDK